MLQHSMQQVQIVSRQRPRQPSGCCSISSRASCTGRPAPSRRSRWLLCSSSSHAASTGQPDLQQQGSASAASDEVQSVGDVPVLQLPPSRAQECQHTFPRHAAGPAPASASTQQQHVVCNTDNTAAAAGLWAHTLTLLQHGLVLATASSLVISMCLTVPAASSAHIILQQQQQQRQQQTQVQRQPHHSIPQSLQQQQQQWQFELPVSSSGSSDGGQSQQQQEHTAALQFELGSQLEDGLLEGMRQFEAGVDRAFGAISTGLHSIDAAQASSEQAAMDAQAQALINEVWEVVDTNYLDARRSGFDHEKWGRLRDEALSRSYYDQRSIHRAVRDMLAQGVSDPYCRFIEPGEFANMKKYDITGVGLNLGTAEEYIKKTGRMLPRPVSGGGVDAGVWVVGLSKDSEADRAGIQQGDEILQVSGLALSGVTPFQAATLIAGPDDTSLSTPVGLVVKKSDGQVVNVTVQRPARYLASPVSSSLQQRYSGERVGVIRLTSFNARALRDVSTALERLQQQGASELVLDLRDNRGGLVSEGLEVARLFLSDSVPIVLTQSKAMAADPPRALSSAATRLPLTVLVNEHTASASEIFAGAIKDNCRGVLVGKRTYGKGLIQSVYELSDSSGLIITVGKYLTPRGVDIDRYGIAPDFNNLPDPTAAEATLNACKLEASAGPEGQRQQQQLQPQLAAAVTAAPQASGVARS